jgi:hypothetical protein
VKLIKSDEYNFVFHISKREKQLLFEILQVYPLVESNYQRLSKTAEPAQVKVDQQLLEEALSAQHRENKTQLRRFLNDEERFAEDKPGYRFTLESHQMEWLLQVLNDVRVGNWLLLGSPDPAQKKTLQVNKQSAPHLWAMELSGYFQMVLLEALSR